MTLCQITPYYPPAISGVGDYAAILGGALQKAGVGVKTLVTSSTPQHDDNSAVVYLPRPSAEALTTTLLDLGVAKILLHFSGYGYGKRGLCRWLVQGLAAWKRARPDARLVTLFHEVYAKGPIWRSSFWTAFPQRRIARDLARLSEAAIVTSHGGRAQLRVLHPALLVRTFPVFSNVGELEKPLSLQSRAPLAVVFGGEGRRRRLYAAAQSQGHGVATLFDRLAITGVLDIGPGAAAPATLAERPVTRLGSLPAEKVSERLATARLGLLDYPRHVLTKSGIAAAYFAHGLLVVNTSSLGQLPDDLEEGREFTTLTRSTIDEVDPEQVAAAGHAWYRGHGIMPTVDWVNIDLKL